MVEATKMIAVLDILSKHYEEGVYPGRSDNSGPPVWPNDPFHVLIATVLSQRTRDENTRKAADRLFSEFYDVESIAKAEVATIEELIRPAGFPHQKAKAIKELCIILRDQYRGIVPRDLEELISLPMVGRKTANCVLAYGFGDDAICVDTHVHRISNLLGEVCTKTPDDTEMILRKKVPQERWKEINRYLVRHGQVICRPRNEKCSGCPIQTFCDYGQERAKIKAFDSN